MEKGDMRTLASTGEGEEACREGKVGSMNGTGEKGEMCTEGGNDICKGGRTYRESQGLWEKIIKKILGV